VERVGGRLPIEIDVRIVAATNVNLKQAIEGGTFREDLYYRLGVVHIHLPPLRDRDEDVLLMARVMLRQAAEHYRKEVHGFTPEAVQALQAYEWPGNVRELSNKIRRAVVMAESPHLTPDDLDLQLDRTQSAATAASLRAARERIESDLIAHAFTAHQGNVTRMAAQLGISRPTLYRLLRRHGLLERLREAS
jgi:two-component system NtrC family response regulator